MIDTKHLEQQLLELRQEHQDLNDVIDNPEQSDEFSEFTLRRLKKRKLQLKDQIKIIEARLNPDIIA